MIDPRFEFQPVAMDLEGLSIVVPCYCEEAGLQALHSRATAAAEALFGDEFELILVDDGSTDRTWIGIEALRATDPRVVGVRLSRNFGHQLALTAGLSVVRRKLVLVLDADLQDPPELLGPMLDLMNSENAEVVYGRRRSRDGETWFKKTSAKLFYKLLAGASKVAIPGDAGDFRLMTARIVRVLVGMPEKDRFVRGMIAWLGFKQVPFVYDRQARFAGETKYPLRKMLRFALDAFLGFSMSLLRISTIFSVVAMIVIIILAAYSLIQWARGNTIEGWTSLALLSTFIGASQLVVMSIIGEYVGRIYIASKERPLFVIDRIVRS